MSEIENRNHCVYKHTLKKDGRVYIGQTIDTSIRWNPNRYTNSKRFYRAIQKYGWDAFEHEAIVDGLTQAEANICEILLIWEHKSTDAEHGFNLCHGGRGHTIKHSDETRAKLALAGARRKHSEETKTKMSQSHRGKHDGPNNPMYRKRGKDSPFYGVPRSDETKEKLSKANYSKNSPRAKQVVCIETGTVYSCAMDVERIFGVNHSNISACCRGKQKSAIGYHWRYA